jgi:hypothetical protein
MQFLINFQMRIFRPKREMAGAGKDFHNLYVSPNIIKVIKSRRMRWEVYLARM